METNGEYVTIDHHTGELPCAKCSWPLQLGDRAWYSNLDDEFYCSKKCAESNSFRPGAPIETKGEPEFSEEVK